MNFTIISFVALLAFFMLANGSTPTTQNTKVEATTFTPILVRVKASIGTAGDILKYHVNTLPSNGVLFQAPEGWMKTEQITTVGTKLNWTSIDTQESALWYQSNSGFVNNFDSFSISVDDGSAQNSATATVTVAVSESCPNQYRPQGNWGQLNGAPTPSVMIQYNETSQVFQFQVQAAYARGATWVIDFSSFDNLNDEVGNATNCENRLTSDFSSVSFQDYWNSAPVATFVGALGTTQYLAYAPSNIWSIKSSSCSQISYTTKRSFSELLSCRDRFAEPSFTATRIPGTPFTDYEGTLYVQLITPLNSSDPSTQYSKAEWAYPFKFRFNMVTNVISTVGSDKDIDVSILSLTLNSVGRMVVRLRTFVKVGFLTNPVAPSAPYPLGVTVSDFSAQPIQEWEYTSEDINTEDYNGQYRFQWDFSTGGKAVAIINIEMKSQTLINDSLSLHTELTTYRDAFVTKASGPFGSGARVYVKDSLTIDTSDANNFEVSIVNVWLCYSDNQYFIPQYNPSSNPPLYGCSQPIPGVMDASNIVQLIQQNTLVTSGIQQYFSTQFHNKNTNPTVFTDTYTKGFSFLAQPLSLQDRVYYIHVETLVQQNGISSKRNSILASRQDSQRTGTGTAINSVFITGGVAGSVAPSSTPVTQSFFEEEVSTGVKFVPFIYIVSIALYLLLQ